MKEDNYNTVLELLDKYKKHILYVIVGILLLFSIIWLSVRQPQMPKEYKDAIDALNKANKELVERQKQLDSTIQVYENEVKQVDNQIDNIKEKTTIIQWVKSTFKNIEIGNPYEFMTLTDNEKDYLEKNSANIEKYAKNIKHSWKISDFILEIAYLFL